MTRTGWAAEDPQPSVPMPQTELLLARQQRRAGTLETALARSRAEEVREAREARARAPDPDERAAGLIARGYAPGRLQELAQRLGDTMAELEAEREKIEKAAHRAQVAARQHAAGRVDVVRMLAMMDGDEGDEGRVAALERRAESLRRQLGELQAMISPPEAGDLDAVEAASRAAHEVFREVTRARWAAAQERPAPRERRPFGSASRGSAEHTGPDCQVCAAARERDAARALEDAVAVHGEIAR